MNPHCQKSFFLALASTNLSTFDLRDNHVDFGTVPCRTSIWRAQHHPVTARASDALHPWTLAEGHLQARRAATVSSRGGRLGRTLKWQTWWRSLMSDIHSGPTSQISTRQHQPRQPARKIIHYYHQIAYRMNSKRRINQLLIYSIIVVYIWRTKILLTAATIVSF